MKGPCFVPRPVFRATPVASVAATRGGLMPSWYWEGRNYYGQSEPWRAVAVLSQGTVRGRMCLDPESQVCIFWEEVRAAAQGQQSKGLYQGLLRLKSIEENMSRPDCRVVRMQKISGRDPRNHTGTYTNGQVCVFGYMIANLAFQHCRI